jgi:hypothetical protein
VLLFQFDYRSESVESQGKSWDQATSFGDQRVARSKIEIQKLEWGLRLARNHEKRDHGAPSGPSFVS